MSTQQDINAIRAQRLANTYDPLALMANTQTLFHPDQSSLITYLQHPQPNNNFVLQPSFNTKYMQQPMNQVVLNAVQNPGVQNVGNKNAFCVDPWIANRYGIRNVVTARAEGNDAYDEIEEVIANCTLNDNLQQASTSSTQTDNAPVYDSDRSAENNSNVKSAVSSVEQSGGTVEQHPATVEETHAYFESLYNNLAIEVEKFYTVNRKMKETNADLTIELARYKNQEKCFEINQEKYDKLESSAKTITTLNEEIANLNNQLSKEKSTVSSLQEENKKLNSDFKIREDELLDKQNQLENKIKELDNILVKIAKFVRDFKSLSKEADESPAKYKTLEFEIECLLRAVASPDIMSVVQSNSVVDTSNLQTEFDRMKEKIENCIIKKEKEYVVLWNNWYTECEECKYNKISYDKDDIDMQQKIERLQAQLGDLKGKSKDTPCESDTLDSLSPKLENENVELEF
ncbi:hypothetical protein Tco_1422737 [Tanacetum coccineum]